MPRLWLFDLPMQLKKEFGANNTIFWYVTGKYGDGCGYPSSRIKKLELYGNASLGPKRRMHIIGVGFDSSKTNAIISTTDPDEYIICSAFDDEHIDVHECVNEINRQIIDSATFTVRFKMDDFAFMFSKLCELANEYLELGDVIFVPDGPKPLIFAMSLVPLLIKKRGVSCLHALSDRNINEVKDVQAGKLIYGFSMRVQEPN